MWSFRGGGTGPADPTAVRLTIYSKIDHMNKD